MGILDGMKKIGGIHTFEDEAFLEWIARASLAVLLAGLIACVAWYALSLVPGSWLPCFEVGRVLASGFAGGARWFIALAAGLLLPLALHELVHAVAFKAFAPKGSRVRFGANWKQGMVYACAEGIVYSRAQYMVIALAPSAVVTCVLLLIGICAGWPLWTLITVFAHLGGCPGDWGYVCHIRRDPSIAYCEDAAWGVQFYSAEGRADGGPDGDDGR